MDEPQKKPLAISLQLYGLLQKLVKVGGANVDELAPTIMRDWNATPD